ncbi:uncharacterized protein ACRADG_002992 [Cochliomyia hominivorax]
MPKPNKFIINSLSRANIMALPEIPPQVPTTECVTIEPAKPIIPKVEDTLNGAEQPHVIGQTSKQPSNNDNDYQNEKARELKNLIQLLYVAQARVQLEATEIKKAQAIANAAQQSLEEAANNVRKITANLQSCQQEVASAAIRAQTAQLQLAAHDQLLFAARQDVDALSSQMVGLQAAEGITQPKSTVDLTDLLEKLKRPLEDAEKPTPVPTVIPINAQTIKHQQKRNRMQYLDVSDYQDQHYRK